MGNGRWGEVGDMQGWTYCYLGGHQIDLVQDEDEMLVGGLGANVLLDTATSGAVGVAGIQDVQDNVAGVDDLVQLVPDALAGALHEDELTRTGQIAVFVLLVRLARGSGQELRLLQPLDVALVHVAGARGQVLDGAEVELGLLALGLGAEGLGEGLRGDGDLGGVLLEAVDVALLLDQAHGQLVALHEERGGVRGLGLDGGAERVEGILGNDTGVVEPLAVGLDAGDGRFTGLVRGSLGDVSGGVSLGLAVGEALEELDLFGVAVQSLASPARLVLCGRAYR